MVYSGLKTLLQHGYKALQVTIKQTYKLCWNFRFIQFSKHGGQFQEALLPKVNQTLCAKCKHKCRSDDIFMTHYVREHSNYIDCYTPVHTYSV